MDLVTFGCIRRSKSEVAICVYQTPDKKFVTCRIDSAAAPPCDTAWGRGAALLIYLFNIAPISADAGIITGVSRTTSDLSVRAIEYRS